MKICVCLKPVPRTTRLDPATLRLDRTVPAILNEWDSHAVEAALQLRESAGGEVVAISMAPGSSADALRPALAMGVDRAFLVDDERLAGADLLVTARVLAAALTKESPDAVLFGSWSSDASGALLWSAVGEAMGLPVLSNASTVALDGGTVVITRQAGAGLESVAAETPAVVALSGAVNTPRYPVMKGIIAAKKKEIPGLSLGHIGLDAEAARPGTQVLGVREPERRASGRVIEASDGVEHEIVDFLVGRGVL